MEMSKIFKRVRAYAEQRSLPVIPIHANSVSILKEPTAFYNTLMEGIRDAKSRVALSALYIGTGAKERAMIGLLQDNLHNNPELDVSITLDKNRSSRDNQTERSAVSMIQEMLGHYPMRLNLIDAKVDSPNRFHQLFSRFQRLNELASTYHAKAMVFDDNLVLTGANLSSIYFEARQDRYIKINKSRLLGDYVCGFLDALQGPTGKSLGNTIDQYNRLFLSKNPYQQFTHDSCIIPLAQLGPQEVLTCDEFLLFLEDILPERSKLHMSTGYFNPKIEVKLTSVIAPSEQANGFYNGGALLKYVPRVYTAIMRNYLRRNPESELYLYDKPDWSFHAKGLWIDGRDDVGIYLIGSSNYNWRSSSRDFELQFLLLTTDPNLKRSFNLEREGLLMYTRQYDSNKDSPFNPIYNLAASLLKSLL